MSNVTLKIETGIQLLTRLTKKPNVENLYPNLFESGPKSGDVIEIISENCMAHLLADMIAEILTKPNLQSDMPTGILLFNTDGNIDREYLINVLKHKIIKLNEANEQFGIKLKESLANLYILDIYDATQFHTTICNMDTILMDHPNIALVIFDSLTAFYWSEQGYKITKMDLYVKSLIHTIKKITKEYKTVCIYTKPAYFTSMNTDHVEVDYRIHLLDLCKGNYQVNIRSAELTATKFYNISNKQIQWC